MPYAREIIRENLLKSNASMLRDFTMHDSRKAEVHSFSMAAGLKIMQGEPLSITIEQLQTEINNMKNNPESFDLEYMVHLADKMTLFYAVMRWTVLFPRPNAAFITSDSPVFRTFANAGGDDALLRTDCSVNCPLSSRSLLK